MNEFCFGLYKGKRCLLLFNVVLGLHFTKKMADQASDAMEAEVTDLPWSVCNFISTL